jgi:hypothetical protein
VVCGPDGPISTIELQPGRNELTLFEHSLQLMEEILEEGVPWPRIDSLFTVGGDDVTHIVWPWAKRWSGDGNADSTSQGGWSLFVRDGVDPAALPGFLNPNLLPSSKLDRQFWQMVAAGKVRLLDPAIASASDGAFGQSNDKRGVYVRVSGPVEGLPLRTVFADTNSPRRSFGEVADWLMTPLQYQFRLHVAINNLDANPTA